MNDTNSKKRWQVTLSPQALIHVHFETASTEVINNGFRGLARDFERSPIR